MTTFEDPMTAQLHGDLRSAHIEFKRSRDSTMKWCRGFIAENTIYDAPVAKIVDVSTARKIVPLRPPAKESSVGRRQNVGKGRPSPYYSPWAARARDTSDARLQTKEGMGFGHADLDEMGSGPGAAAAAAAVAAAASSGIFYSFDHTDSPPDALSLEAYMKPNVRATEKLVEREYEVLDGNGDAVSGRKARHVLRREAAGAGALSTAGPSTAPKAPLIEVLDDEDFELV